MTANRKTGVKPETSAPEARAEAWMEGLEFVDFEMNGEKVIIRAETGDGPIVAKFYVDATVMEVACKIDRDHYGEYDAFVVEVNYSSGHEYLRWNAPIDEFIKFYNWLKKYISS